LTAVETTVAAPFEQVWRALRDPEEIRRWHGWEYDGLAEEIDVIYVRDVDADEQAGTLAMADGSRFELERAGDDATVVRVRMPARAGGDAYDEIREGWASFVLQLRFALERHPGEERRTLQLFGTDPAPLDPGPVGERYEGETTWGEHWSGEVLFRDEHQVVMTVDEYGPGLVVLHAEPDGGGMAIVTAYGLDDEAFAALERRWRDGY